MKMVAIFTYEMGLRFTGKIAKDEASAWEYLDKTYGLKLYGVQLPCNHDAFFIKKVEEVKG